MISGAYAQEYGQAEEMEKALQKVQVSGKKPLQKVVVFFLDISKLYLFLCCIMHPWNKDTSLILGTLFFPKTALGERCPDILTPWRGVQL